MRIAGGRALLEIVQLLHCRGFPPRRSISAGQIGSERWAAPGKLDGLLYFCDCFPEHVFFEIPLTQLVMSKSKIRIHFDRLAALLYRFVRKMCDKKKLCQIRIDDEGEWIKVLRLSHFGDGLSVAS